MKRLGRPPGGESAKPRVISFRVNDEESVKIKRLAQLKKTTQAALAYEAFRRYIQPVVIKD